MKKFAATYIAISAVAFFMAYITTSCTHAPIPPGDVTTTPAPLPAPAGPTLKDIAKMPVLGDTGEHVKALQVALNANGAKLTPDGQFGKVTTAAIASFQKSKGLSGSGVMGPQTLAMLGLKVKTAGLVALSWDTEVLYKARSGDPEWSNYLTERMKRDLRDYKAAKDIERICPKFQTLTEIEQIKALGEFWVALAVYESSWNPKTANVDVGKPEAKDTWSVGLYQVSVVDKANREVTKYNYDQLLTAIPNINLAATIMQRQLKNYGRIILPNSSPGRYWAVILEGNKYSKIPAIIQRINKTAPFCW